ncbi:MAG: DUF1552 domain-containing protein [Pirellulaceae bacterium]
MLFSNNNRRNFLRAAGVCIALPTLESLCIRRTWATTPSPENAPPQRMLCVGNEFGMYPGAFWPTQSGPLFEMTPLLRPLEEHRHDLTIFSHLDHGLKGGHFAVHTFLTGVKSTESKSVEDGGISLDQRAAEFVGSRTRFPSLNVGSEGGLHGGCQMSWTRTGTRVPPIEGPRELFRQLFVDDSPSAKALATERIARQESILDSVLEDARALGRRINSADHHKLEEYLASVRSVETKLALDQHWQRIAKPLPTLAEPEDEGLTLDLPKIYDLLALAFQTDSTRVATLEVGGSFIAADLGVKQGYHGLSHHGQVQANIDLLIQLELYQVQQLARFLDRLKSLTEPNSDGNLLNHTMVLFGSGMGNANSHTNHDLPIILAGGGFRHGELKEFPSENARRVPLCNLFVSMLQRFGVETDHFGTSTGTLRNLDVG